MKIFKPNCKALLIGSLPISDHEDATRLVLDYTPDIPLWVQLPAYKEEGMIYQFIPGMPGVVSDTEKDKVYIQSDGESFDEELAAFYETYLAITEQNYPIEETRFALSHETAKGFFSFMKIIQSLPTPPWAVKGQVTGPITMGVSLTDQNGRSIFYDDTLKDIVSKHIALKARWQVHQLKKLNPSIPPIIFFDEPGIVSFGSSAYISLSRDDVNTALAECIDAVHAEGGIAGIHICANGDWSLALESNTDIISFDAYSYFNQFSLYKELIQSFISSGRILAWGIVPTGKIEDIEKETTQSLIKLWDSQMDQVAALGFSINQLMSQSLITPSCGTGSLSFDHAMTVLTQTKEISEQIRKRIKE